MPDQIENVKKFARRAAIAAVISRNLAHNTGSHKAPWVKFFINNRLERIHNYLESNDIENLPQEYKNLLKARKDLESATQSDVIEYYSRKSEAAKAEANRVNDELLYYFDFFNANMEFIADITSAFDGTRGNFSISTKDLVDEFIEQKFVQSGLTDDYYFLGNTDVPNTKISINNNNPGYEAKLNIPNGHLGRVAFLILLENIIRNYYKHSRIEDGINLWFRFDDLNDDYISVDIFDGNGLSNAELRNTELLERINRLIKEPILNKDNSLRQEGWGLFEMKICAAYLIDFPLDLIDDSVDCIDPQKGKFFPLLTANFYSDDVQNFKIDPNEKNLGYRFYLKRPKKIYIDRKLFENMDDFPVKELKKEGVVFGDIDKGIKYLYSAYELVVTHREKANLIDENQRFLYVDYDKFKFEFENNQGYKSSYIFKKWLENIISEKRTNEIGNILWVNYLKQKEYKVKHDEFRIVKTEEDLIQIRNKFPNILHEQLVIFDNHGTGVISIGENEFENLKTYLWYTHEDSQTKYWIWDLISFNTETSVDFRKKLHFTEILNIHIGIFDERIQQETAFRYRNNQRLTISNLLALNGIHIPDYGLIDLSRIVEQEAGKFEQMLYASLSRNEYTILHYTIFERIARFRGIKNNIDGLTEYYKLIVDGTPNRLVFCSGRGRPSNLIEGCYYLHLSTLRDILIRIRSKYHLVHALKSLRKTYSKSPYA